MLHWQAVPVGGRGRSGRESAARRCGPAGTCHLAGGGGRAHVASHGVAGRRHRDEAAGLGHAIALQHCVWQEVRGRRRWAGIQAARPPASIRCAASHPEARMEQPTQHSCRRSTHPWLRSRCGGSQRPLQRWGWPRCSAAAPRLRWGASGPGAERGGRAGRRRGAGAWAGQARGLLPLRSGTVQRRRHCGETPQARWAGTNAVAHLPPAP